MTINAAPTGTGNDPTLPTAEQLGVTTNLHALTTVIAPQGSQPTDEEQLCFLRNCKKPAATKKHAKGEGARTSKKGTDQLQAETSNLRE